jgi:hypothetical protein
MRRTARVARAVVQIPGSPAGRLFCAPTNDALVVVSESGIAFPEIAANEIRSGRQKKGEGEEQGPGKKEDAKQCSTHRCFRDLDCDRR